MSDLAKDLEEILMRTMADGASVIPVEVLFDLLGHGPRQSSDAHEIVFPGATHTWFMRHPESCGPQCFHAATARLQFPNHDSTFAPGEYVAALTDTGHLITTAKG